MTGHLQTVAASASHPHWNNAGDREHFVQFYDDETVILGAVNDFVRRGLDEGAAAIVIATRAHLGELERQWTEHGYDVAAARERGQYVPLEAAETLEHFVVDGWPQPRRFVEVIEPAIAGALRRYPRVVAFGEMVALLWDAGRHGAAVRLEELWNELAQRHGFTLFCAYRTASESGGPADMLHQVRAQHSRTISPAPRFAGLRAAPSAPRELKPTAESARLDAAGVLALREHVAQLEQELAERKRMERVLARREQELADFFENAPYPLHSMGSDGVILWANRSELDLLGYAPEEFVGRPIADFHVEEGRADGIIERLRSGETLHDEPVALRARDGSERHVLLHTNGLWEDGELLHTRCLLRDVTGLREGEQARRLLASIVESSDDAIVSKTLDGRITSWNSAAVRLFGYSADEIVGRLVTTIIPPELHPEETMILAKLRAGERIDHFETTRVAKDGRRIPVSLTVSPLRDASGQVVGASKVLRDISDLRRAEVERREAERRKDEFLAMLGHELRNPLAPVRNATEVLRRSARGSPVQEQMCQVLDRQVELMSRLLDDLLEVSRVTQGKIKFRREPLDLLTVVARAIEICRPQIDARGHELSVDIPSRPLRVTGDLTRLVQALSNLLHNAAKYTPDGGEIALSLAAADGIAVIRVRDNGVGIPADLLPSIFEMFVQAERTLERSQGGLGIGLTLVRSIVERHAGRVEALSPGAGRGSEFVIRLPLLDERARPVRDEAPAPAATSAETAGVRRVLVVDDNRDAADSLAMLLRLGGHRVVVALDGPSALAAEAELRADLVLLDIGLPGMSGFEVARRLREGGCTACIAALSGSGQPEDQQRAFASGFDRHFVKPLDPAVLDALLA